MVTRIDNSNLSTFIKYRHKVVCENYAEWLEIDSMNKSGYSLFKDKTNT